MKIKNENEVMTLPNDMDKECIELSNLLNRLPGVRTIESCMGHGKHPYWLFFQCMDINTLSRLSRAVCDRYSDGRWEIMCDSGDGEPRGRFWLRTIEILDIDTLNKSIKELMENIEYWFQDEFDDYFENGYKNINGEYVAEQNLDYYGNPLSLEEQFNEQQDMEQYIKKAATLVAEIKKRLKHNGARAELDRSVFMAGREKEDEDILSSINTLEVKENLTWEDIRELYIIFAEVDAEIELCKTDIKTETIGYYQEVLKRFKAKRK